MIRSLRLKNYRGFEDYTLSDLSRVNLLVGKNNSGKTAILEAVQLVATGGNSRELTNLARQRGEFISGSIDPSNEKLRTYPDVTHIFRGHTLKEGSFFSLSTEGDLGSLTVSIVRYEEGYRHLRNFPLDEALTFSGLGVLSEFRRPGSSDPGPRSTVPVTEEGAILFHRPRPYGWSNQETFDGRPVRLIPQGSLDRRLMNEMWEQVLTEIKERDVSEAMRILDPNISSIAFLSNDPSYGREPRSGILLGFEGEQRRQPLGSHGEGMRRVLALALCLTTTRNGILLIDEVDTGLHYSVLGDVWHLIVETAKRHDMQVFLTTHSLDSIRALAWVCETHPELASEVSLQKIERALDEAVAFSADQIQIAVEQDIEVR